MENTLLVGSNTLSNIAKLATGYCITATIMGTTDEEAVVRLEFVAIKKDGTLAKKEMPKLKVEAKLETLDQELTGAVYEIFQGELAGTTHRLGDYARALEEATTKAGEELDAKNKPAAAPAAASSMPPPTGRKEGASTPAKPAPPKKPAAPKKPGSEPAPEMFVAPTPEETTPAPAEPAIEDTTYEEVTEPTPTVAAVVESVAVAAGSEEDADLGF